MNEDAKSWYLNNKEKITNRNAWYISNGAVGNYVFVDSKIKGLTEESIRLILALPEEYKIYQRFTWADHLITDYLYGTPTVYALKELISMDTKEIYPETDIQQNVSSTEDEEVETFEESVRRTNKERAERTAFIWADIDEEVDWEDL